MNELSVAQLRSLHLRSTVVGSVLSGLGVAAGIALLVLIALSLNHEHPTNAQMIQQIAGRSAIYALCAALVIVLFGFTLHGVVRLFNHGESLKGHFGVSQLLASLTGFVLGSGIWIWQVMLVKSPEGNLPLVAIHVGVTLATAILTAGLWIGLSSLLKIRKTAAGQSLSNILGLIAGLYSLCPGGGMLLGILVNP